MNDCTWIAAPLSLANCAMSAPSATSGRSLIPAVAAATAALLVGCAAGPDYVRAQVEAPSAYKETGPWKIARPQAIDSRHPWWALYGDSTLDALIVQANQAGLPLVLGQGEGSELRRPLGYAMVGGLLLSQALTLFTTPVIYLYLCLDRAHHWFARRGRGGKAMIGPGRAAFSCGPEQSERSGDRMKTPPLVLPVNPTPARDAPSEALPGGRAENASAGRHVHCFKFWTSSFPDQSHHVHQPGFPCFRAVVCMAGRDRHVALTLLALLFLLPQDGGDVANIGAAVVGWRVSLDGNDMKAGLVAISLHATFVPLGRSRSPWRLARRTAVVQVGVARLPTI